MSAPAIVAKAIAVPLKNEFLLRQACFIRGAWTEAADGRTITVRNPASGAAIGTVPRMGTEEARRAIRAADAALPAWRARTARGRAAILRRWFELIMANQEDLATLMTAEQGKPMTESRGEVASAAAAIEWFAGEARRVHGDTFPPHLADQRILVLREPVGVVAAITPWSFPAAMIGRKAGPALAAGCTVVLKPASATPFSALALAELGEQAGLPAGVFNVITGDSKAIGQELTTNPMVRKVSFTGSAEIGKQLMAQCASTVKQVSLEVGGDAPFIVFDDADLDAAVVGALQGSSRNGGQTGAGLRRILVQDGVHDLFARKLADAVGRLRVGDDPTAETQPPRIDEGAASRELAIGPRAPLSRFETEEEALRLANATESGLACCVYTRDLARSWRVSERLQYGAVGINTGLISTEVARFGGIEEYLETKVVCIGGIS